MIKAEDLGDIVEIWMLKNKSPQNSVVEISYRNLCSSIVLYPPFACSLSCIFYIYEHIPAFIISFINMQIYSFIYAQLYQLISWCNYRARNIAEKDSLEHELLPCNDIFILYNICQEALIEVQKMFSQG